MSKKVSSGRRRALALCVLCTWLGCGEEQGDHAHDVAGSTSGGAIGGAAGTQASSMSFATTIMPKINEACSCHQSSPILMAPFSLKVGEAYTNLVGAASGQVPTMVRVKPGSLTESYLWHKIKNTQASVGGTGLIMPSNIPLRADEIALFEGWIMAGAPP